VARQSGQFWVGIKTHMGCDQQAYDAECATLARALQSASGKQTIPERVTFFTDPNPLSDGWPQRSLAPAKDMRSWWGSTLLK